MSGMVWVDSDGLSCAYGLTIMESPGARERKWRKLRVNSVVQPALRAPMR
jgi:hypothetical protein